MMYNFTDIRDAPTAGVGIGMVFNGQDLLARMNNANGSFKVLTVSGRGLLAQHHQTTDVVGRHGKYFHRKTYETRELVVKVLLEGNNDLAYRKQYELLNTLLDSPAPAYLSFSDEPDRFYLAQFKVADAGEEVANRTVLNLSFVCYDPFKYSEERSLGRSSENYLKNSDFSNNSTSWSQHQSSDFGLYFNYQHSTKNRGRTGAHFWYHRSGASDYYGLQQTFDFEGKQGDKVTVSLLAAKDGNASGLRVGLHFRNAGSIVAQEWKLISNSQLSYEYQSFSFTFTLPTNVDELNLMLFGEGGKTSNLYVTDVQFEKSETSTNWTPASSDFKSRTAAVIGYLGDFPSKPIVTVTVKAANRLLTLTRTTSGQSAKYLRLELPSGQTFAVGDVVVFNCQTGAITRNGANALANFDMVNSRFFELFKGPNTLRTNVSCDFAVEYREVYL